MILLAESGSSKTDWCLLDNDSVVWRQNTIGINPYFVDSAKMAEVLNESIVPMLSKNQDVSEVVFYGAGCSTEKMCSILKNGILQVFPIASVHIYSDMIAAARSLCGDGPGIVAILGTGSNSCAFNKGEIIEQTASLGYVLGDEGGGVDIGKKLLRAFCYSELPSHLMKAFKEKYNLTKDNLLEEIYKKPQPNRFIASFVPFLTENPDPFFTELISNSFAEFLSQHVLKYKALPRNTPLYITGSIAWIFSDILKKEIEKQSLVLGEIIQSPMEGLINYHKK